MGNCPAVIRSFDSRYLTPEEPVRRSPADRIAVLIRREHIDVEAIVPRISPAEVNLYDSNGDCGVDLSFKRGSAS